MYDTDLCKLFWSTRGKDWGFRFVHVPTQYAMNWHDVYDKIFSKDDCMPQRWYGRMLLPNNKQIPYVASRFHDIHENWIDSAGRQIPHEMILLLTNGFACDIAKTEWETSVMACVRDRYRDAYNKDAALLNPFVLTTGVHISGDRATNLSDTQEKNVRIRQNDSAGLFPKLREILNTDIGELMKKL